MTRTVDGTLDGTFRRHAGLCTISVSAEICAMAKELASLLDLDVETFIAIVVHDLYQDEAVSGSLAARGAGLVAPWRDGNVIARLTEHTRKQRASVKSA